MLSHRSAVGLCYSQTPLNALTRLIRTPHYYGQFTLFAPWKKKGPNIFSKLNPVNTDTFFGPSVSVLTGFMTVFGMSLKVP